MKNLLKSLIFVLLIYLSFIFIESKFFLIREIDVIGDVSLVKKDIVDEFMKVKNKSIFSYDFSIIENRILDDIRIDYINIKRKFPDKIELEINVRKAIGLIEKDENFYFIDKNLNIFSYYDELKNEKLPIINIEEDEEELKKLKQILNNLIDSKIYSYISEIYKNEKYTLTLLDGTKVYVDEDVKKEKYDAAFEIYEKEKKIYNLEYIELRFKNIAIK